MLLSTGWILGEAGVYPPIIGMWVPNVVMGSLGLFFLVRAQKEKSLIVDKAVKRLWYWLVEHLSFLRKRFSLP